LQTSGISANVGTEMARERRRFLPHPISLVLAGVALLGFVLTVASLPHTHDPGRPGVYNQEHDLGYLATFNGGGPLPDTPSADPVVVLLTVAVATLAAAGPVVHRRHADFRAPPVR
jgi:hypothetical protein